MDGKAMAVPVPVPVKDAKQDLAPSGASVKPTDDQVYLAERISERWDRRGRITPAALCNLNKRYGIAVVTSALRLARGFPPPESKTSAFAYVESICKESA